VVAKFEVEVGVIAGKTRFLTDLEKFGVKKNRLLVEKIVGMVVGGVVFVVVGVVEVASVVEVVAESVAGVWWVLGLLVVVVIPCSCSWGD